MVETKGSDKWYTPPQVVDLVVQVLGEIDLDPCADDGKHIPVTHHYTANDDGLSLEWHGRVFMNPPYSCPGKWMAKLQAEIEAGRVTEAIALIPAATDTNWLSPLLATQLICFWKGRIKFLDTNYEPKQSARQSHCFVYWGENWHRFKEIFDSFGVVKMPDRAACRRQGNWNPDHFGEVPRQIEANGQVAVFYDDSQEPPLPDDYPTISDYDEAWTQWQLKNSPAKVKTMTKFQFSSTQEIADQLTQLQQQINQLTNSFKPLQECEQKANDLRQEIAKASLEMTDKGIGQEDLLKWAKLLYSAASGLELVEETTALEKLHAIAAQNEAIAELKNQLNGAQKREEKALAELAETKKLLQAVSLSSVEIATKLKFCEQERDQLKLKLENSSTAEQIVHLLEDNHALSGVEIMQLLGINKEEGRMIYAELNRLQSEGIIFSELSSEDKRCKVYSKCVDNKIPQNTSTMSVLKKEIPQDTKCVDDEISQNTSIISVGQRVAVVDVGEEDNLEYLIGHKGTIATAEGERVTVFFEERFEFGNRYVELDRRYLGFASLNPIATQRKGKEFIASIKTKAGANNITWQNISEVCQASLLVFREILLSASTKLQKDFVDINNLAKLMSDYVSETGDVSDFVWLDNTFIAKVEALVEAKKSLPYQKGDWVRSRETGEIWQVRNFDGEWLSAIADNKVRSLHRSEVDLALEVAA